MQELLEAEITEKKEELRRKFELSIEDIKTIEMHQARRSRKRSRSTSSSSDDSKKFRSYQFKQPNDLRNSRRSKDSPMQNNKRFKRSKSPSKIEDSPISLVSVCRFISALDGELGILAQNVITLLSEAVAQEKMKPNSADELLFDPKNSILLETVRAKFQGILSANFSEPRRQAAIKRAIQNIDELVRSTKQMSLSSNYSKESDANEKYFSEKEMIDDSNNQLKDCVVTINPHIKQNDSQPITSVSSTQNMFVPNSDLYLKEESCLEKLSDEDFKLLLGNFSELTPDEQTYLIGFLTKVEKNNPERFERLQRSISGCF